MSLGISLSHSESASEPLSVNSELGTYPPQHPEKSLIFLGTRLTPLPLLREGGIMISEGADAPSGFPFTISYQKGDGVTQINSEEVS